MSLVQVFTTLSSRGDAIALARSAVDERMAACVQVVGPITSVYRWEGRVEEAEEYLCVMKTTSPGVEALTTFVRDRHPYDTPEITAVDSVYVDERYFAWAGSETGAGT